MSGMSELSRVRAGHGKVEKLWGEEVGGGGGVVVGLGEKNSRP